MSDQFCIMVINDGPIPCQMKIISSSIYVQVSVCTLLITINHNNNYYCYHNNSYDNNEIGLLQLELSQQFPGFRVTLHNIIMDVLGCFSKATAKRCWECREQKTFSCKCRKQSYQAPCILKDLSRYVLNSVNS